MTNPKRELRPLHRVIRAARWTLLACIPITLVPILAWLTAPSVVFDAPAFDPSGLLGLVYTILPPSSILGPPIFWFYGSLATGLAGAVAVASALLLRAPDRPGALLLAGFLVTCSLYFSIVLIGVPHSVPSVVAEVEMTLRWLWVTSSGAAFGVGLMCLVEFAAKFPQPLTQEDLERAFPKPAKGRRVVRIDSRYAWGLLPLFTAASAWVPVRWPGFGPPWAMLFFSTLSLSALFVVHQLFRVSASSADQAARRRVRWVSSGVSSALWLWIVFGILAFALTWLDGDFGITAYMMGLFVFGPLGMALTLVLTLALAVFVGGALDPGLTIRRTTVYGTLILFFAFGFAVLEELVSELLVDRIGVSDRLAAVVLGAVVAVAVAPLKGVADRAVERWLPSADSSVIESDTTSTI